MQQKKIADPRMSKRTYNTRSNQLSYTAITKGEGGSRTHIAVLSALKIKNLQIAGPSLVKTDFSFLLRTLPLSYFPKRPLTWPPEPMDLAGLLSAVKKG